MNPIVDGAVVEVEEIGGMCPVQATGKVTVPYPPPTRGSHIHDWYFRARGQHWTVAVGRSDRDGYVSGHGADLLVAGPSDDIRPYSAGYMEDDESERHITFALALFVAGIRGVVEIPDPPEMRPPCFNCGAPANHRIGQWITACDEHVDGIRAELAKADAS